MSEKDVSTSEVSVDETQQQTDETNLSVNNNTESEKTTEELIKSLWLEDEFGVKDDSEYLDDDKTPSEVTEDPQDEDSDEELTALEDRLKDFEQDDEPDDVPQDVKFERELNAVGKALEAKQAELKNFFNDLPQGGVYQYNGKSIYEMQTGEMNDYLTYLRDNNREYEAGQVQAAHLKAIDLSHKYKIEADQFNADVAKYTEGTQQLKDYRSNQEWNQIEQELSTQLPELSKDELTKAGNYIAELAKKDQDYRESLSTKEGKTKRVIEALNKTGAINRLKSLLQQDTKPSAAPPDASAGSKRVKHKVENTGDMADKIARASRMSQESFNKLSDEEIAQLLEASIG